MRESRTWTTQSEEETITVGEEIALELPARSVVLLIGNLGAGKTTIAKGIVKGLGSGASRRCLQPHIHFDS